MSIKLSTAMIFRKCFQLMGRLLRLLFLQRDSLVRTNPAKILTIVATSEKQKFFSTCQPRRLLWLKTKKSAQVC